MSTDKQPLNKSKLIDEVHEILGQSVPRSAAEKALTSVLEAIENGIVNHGGVQIVGFGSFVVKDRAARTVRNPRTGEPIEVAATKVCSFKPGTALKRRLDQEG